MDKALIEKAFEKWLDDYKSRSRCTHLDAFSGGATWQREQLIKIINELVDAVNKLEQKNNCEIETCDHIWGTISYGNKSEQAVCLKCGKVGTGESIYNSEDINYSEKPNSSKEK